MATYKTWNDALIDYTLRGLDIGSRVFLSIDATKLETIGYTFNQPVHSHGWYFDFIQAVRKRVIHRNKVELSRITYPALRDSEDRPRYVGFLALMVLAAHDMGGDRENESIEPTAFYAHLNHLLGLSAEEGRPLGLKHKDTDQKLWEDWNSWLRSKGFIPTAEAGEKAYKYTNYPISQTLLRKSDKNSLWRFFTQHNWRKNYDEVLVMQKLLRSTQYLTSHLRDDLLNPNSNMYIRLSEEISAACYEVYEEWREAGGAERSKATSSPRVRRSLDANIYRDEDFFSGSVDYYVFPRQPKQALHADLAIDFEGHHYELEQDRFGWYKPLWSLQEHHLTEGLEVDVRSSNSPIEKLYLSKRDFWVLTLDPEIPESGIYASWDKGIEVGAQFILLARDTLEDDLKKLREAGLVEWTATEDIFNGWVEYHNMIVLSEPDAWENLHLDNEALRLTLEPRASFSIRFVGGIRAPRGFGWFVGHMPEITLSATLPNADFKILDDTEAVIASGHIESEEPTTLPNLQAGNYRVIVDKGGQIAEKALRILEWEDIQARLLDFEQIMESELKTNIYGAMVGG
jgi:hypothetical protein